jgi:uncharacterized protein YndB with AHSA1/START domain
MTTIVAKMEVDIIESDVVLTRIFDAPRAMVFKAWTVPAQLALWFGPHGYTNPVCRIDAQAGGEYRIVMRSPEGIDYPLKGTFIEVDEPQRLVCDDNLEEHPAEWFELLNKNRPKDAGELPKIYRRTTTFEEIGGKTKIAIRNHFISSVDRDVMLKMGMAEGWGQSLERLEDLLAKKMSGAS